MAIKIPLKERIKNNLWKIILFLGVIIFFILMFLPSAKAYQETIFQCGGDEETIFPCFGDQENFFISKEPGVGFPRQEILGERIEVVGYNIWIILGIALFFFLIIFIIWFFYKRRCKK